MNRHLVKTARTQCREVVTPRMCVGVWRAVRAVVVFLCVGIGLEVAVAIAFVWNARDGRGDERWSALVFSGDDFVIETPGVRTRFTQEVPGWRGIAEPDGRTHTIATSRVGWPWGAVVVVHRFEDDPEPLPGTINVHPHWLDRTAVVRPGGSIGLDAAALIGNIAVLGSMGWVLWRAGRFCWHLRRIEGVVGPAGV